MKTLFILISLCLFPAPLWSAQVAQLQVKNISCMNGDKVVRSLLYNQEPSYIIFTPQLTTKIIKQQDLACTPIESNQFDQLLNSVYQPPFPLQNDGLISGNAQNGYFLTMDLCPSHRPGWDQEIISGIAKLEQIKTPKLINIGIAISGEWIVHHPKTFNFLISENHKQINIIWINHTFSHPYFPQTPLPLNFMLAPKANLDQEILKWETLLLEHDQVISPFFRFPGLISNESLMAKLKTYNLIPLGTQAWMAKGEIPKPGAIILLHGNENEPQGIKLFFKWLESQPAPVLFLNLLDIKK